ncbi:hypothetical protein [Chryseobacterium gallinarum]|uniref:Lipoprotein n=1 Tax=Chryseobacterium gallinarum TaxID=1324352 RepID=A0ABX6KNC7_CHRGL|nr:hypothetical protein [Chryseobacterium gallinarum]QIY90148.1 hypothetical protein FOB44_05515 [Chryseobacterium gallinarum]
MKKILFLSSMVVLSCFSSCSNDDSALNPINQTEQLNDQTNTASKISDSDLIKMLENKYKISIASDISIDKNFLSLLNSTLLANIGTSGYKFSDGTNDMYAIPFKGIPTKQFVSNFKDFQAIMENNVDGNGDGEIIITSEEVRVIKVFSKGVQVDIKEEAGVKEPLLENASIANTAKKPFRKCFDQAYDDICDGFIGCLAWYASPLPALTSVVYCGVKTL